MKLMSWIQFRRKRPDPVPLEPPVNLTLVASRFDEVADERDHALLGTVLNSLNDQMQEVINRNADGVNRAAISLRRETDLLLSLGISDPCAGKAGSYAQMALELANAGRGMSLQAQPYNLAPQQRADLVARAMTLMLRAEMLMVAVKKNNRTNIEKALAHQDQLMRGLRTALAYQTR
jgi:hypothetical protein